MSQRMKKLQKKNVNSISQYEKGTACESSSFFIPMMALLQEKKPRSIRTERGFSRFLFVE